MLPSSNATITLKPSKDYLRCAVCLHLIAAACVIHSGLPWTIRIVCLLVLGMLLLSIVRIRAPVQQLSYQSGCWFLYGLNESNYSTMIATSRGLSAGSGNLFASLDPADKPKDVGVIDRGEELQIKYEKITLDFDTGLFMLLTLTGANQRKKWVIFKDQISSADYRIFKLFTVP